MPSYVTDCTYFIIDSRCFGRADSGDVCEGYIVVILLDCGRPAILRKVSENVYQLIAFAWVYGVMDGEMI